MDPQLLEGYADEMAGIIAEEQIRQSEVLAFASAPETKEEVERRENLLKRWYDRAYGQRGDQDVDENGRTILRDFTSVRDFLAWGMMAS